MLDKFLTDNSTSMRLARTIVQGVIAALIVFIPSAVGISISRLKWHP